ncbi:LysO family transporter [Clostridiaceae bacterium 35-E11]
MRILLYTAIILLGAYIGYHDKLSETVLKKLSKIQYGCLLFLLFIMGINIGVNRDVVMKFHQLGYQALVLSALSVVFSILLVRFTSKLLQKENRGITKYDN